MAITFTPVTAADGTFSSSGSAAWAAGMKVGGLSATSGAILFSTDATTLAQSADFTYTSTGGPVFISQGGGAGVNILTITGNNISGNPNQTATLTFRAVDGLSNIKQSIGSSGGGWAFLDFNNLNLLTLGRQTGGFGGSWAIQGTNNTSPGDFGPGTDNSVNIGGASNRVKTIYSVAFQGAYNAADGTAGVASFGPSIVTSITVKNGIITAIS